MGEWGSEEELLEWGRDGESVLDFGSGGSVGSKGSEEDDAVLVGKGLKIPETWVDVISDSVKKQGSSKL